MNKNGALILVVVLIVLSIAGFVYYKKNYFPKYSWVADYKKSSDQPYGLKLFYKVISKQKTKTLLLFNRAYNTLDTNLSSSNFIFVGDDFWLDSLDARHLLKYIKKGNRVLISSNRCPLEIVKYFVPVNQYISAYDQQRYSRFTEKFVTRDIPFPGKINFHYQSLKDTVPTFWSAYNHNYFNDTLKAYGFEPFSCINDSNINAFYIRYGKGKIILHANPLLFTNYYMITQNGFKHANNFLSQLHQGVTYWDDPNSVQRNTSEHRANPLKFLFSHPHLKWAWYVLLSTIFIYLVFRSKREQRVIPLMPVNVNTSIEFTKAIGTLYFLNKGHNHIAHEMHLVFLSEVRSRYNIATDIAEGALVDLLSQHSGISKNIIYNLFKQFNKVRFNSEVKSDDLIDLYNAIENYHKKRK